MPRPPEPPPTVTSAVKDLIRGDWAVVDPMNRGGVLVYAATQYGDVTYLDIDGVGIMGMPSDQLVVVTGHDELPAIPAGERLSLANPEEPPPPGPAAAAEGPPRKAGKKK